MKKNLLLLSLLFSALINQAQETTTQWLCPSTHAFWGEKGLMMLDYPTNGQDQFFLTDSLSLTTLADGSHVLEGKLPHRNDATKGLNIYVELSAAMDWEAWSNQDTPTSYLDDNNNMGDAYLDWQYLLIQAENSVATGYGAMEGTSFGIAHAPASGYYGFQIGNGAHQEDLTDSAYGWSLLLGTYVDTSLAINDSEFAEGGTFSFTFGCAPEPVAESTVEWLCPSNHTSLGENALHFVSNTYATGDLTTDSTSLTINDDGSAQLFSKLMSIENPSKGFYLNLQLINEMDWDTWSNQDFPTSYLDDLSIIENEYLDWSYYIVDGTTSTMIGFGALQGTNMSVEHGPSNMYYPIQMGLGAHQQDLSMGLGGLFTATGTYIDSDNDVVEEDALLGGVMNYTFGCEPTNEPDENAPVPDAEVLEEIVSECGSVTLTPPTATDDVSGNITATTNTQFPITTEGTTTVVWTFTDENGNTTTQTQDVTITPINSSIAQTSITTLSVEATGYTYQWIDCDNGNEPVEGATEQSFVPPNLGLYACMISNGECEVTSECISLTSGISGEMDNASLQLYPNPAADWLSISTSESLIGKSYSIFDEPGREIQYGRLINASKVDIQNLAKGTYTIIVDGFAAQRFVKG